MQSKNRQLKKDGTPRRRPGRKPRAPIDLEATAQPSALDRCYAAADAAADPGAAAEAFRRAMPPMGTVTLKEWASIVAHGVARRALTGKEASTMLYAAQVSNSGR
jgi:hypothetical protein